MTTKHKIILQSIKDIESRLLPLDELIEARPLSKIIEIKSEFAEMLKSNTTLEQRTSKNFFEKVKSMRDEEVKLFAIVDKQKDIDKLIEEKIELQFELQDLKNELFYIERALV